MPSIFAGLHLCIWSPLKEEKNNLCIWSRDSLLVIKIPEHRFSFQSSVFLRHLSLLTDLFILLSSSIHTGINISHELCHYLISFIQDAFSLLSKYVKEGIVQEERQLLFSFQLLFSPIFLVLRTLAFSLPLSSLYTPHQQKSNVT